jgi:hypothetical protein
MTIHHATVKRATSLGITLIDNEDDTYTAVHKARKIELEGDDVKALVIYVAVAAAVAVEYPHVIVNDDGSCSTADGDEFYQIDAERSIEANVADLIDAAPVADEEEGEGSVVVAERYKQEYAARGDASGCGDWLHQTLKRYSTEAKDAGKTVTVFDEPSFTAMLIANGITPKGKFADMPSSGKKGWEGRYRMNGRQMLEAPLLRANGVLVLETGQSVVMPDEDYEALLSLKRHKTLREELETAEAEAEEQAKKPAPKAKAKARRK